MFLASPRSPEDDQGSTARPRFECTGTIAPAEPISSLSHGRLARMLKSKPMGSLAIKWKNSFKRS
jgi:hypothetical protein